MDILTFVSKAIENLAWPIVLITSLWLFRLPLSALLDAIKEAKLKIAREKGGITIEGELNTIREKIEKSPEKALPDHVQKLVASSPKRAIEESWRDLEQSATAAIPVSTTLPTITTPIKIADMLLDKKILNQNEAEAFLKLYELKTYATKPGSMYVTDTSTATAYSNLAYSLAEKFKPKG